MAWEESLADFTPSFQNHLHISHQSPEQPEVPGLQKHIRGRGVAHGGCAAAPRGFLSHHDYGDPSVGEGSPQGAWVGCEHPCRSRVGPAAEQSAWAVFSPSSMLYSGSDVIRDLEWVIFDEVHYINDAEVSSG